MRAVSRLLPHPLVIASFTLAFAFYMIYGQLPFDDPDAPWHIAAGDWILAHHSIPHTDPFSYTAGNTPWYNISWLWDIALSAATSSAGGLLGAQLLGVMTAALAVALLCYSLQKRGIKEDPIKVALFLSGLVFASYSLVRPQQVSYVCIILFHILLHDSREQRRISTLVILPLLMVLWVNMHGFFLVGFTLFGAYGLEALWRNDKAWFRYLFIGGAACFVAMFLNPYGVGIITATLRTLDSVITSYINEWHPFTYGNILPSTLYVLAIIMVSNPRDKDIPLADKILTFCWLLMALNSIRNFVALACVAAPYMAMNMQKAMVLHPQKDVSAPKYRLGMAGLACAVVVVLALPATQHYLGRDKMPADVPVEEMAYIREHYPDTRFLNDYGLGGYLIYYLHDIQKVFVDGRAGTAYSEALLRDFLKFYSLMPGFEKMIDSYHVNGIIVKKNHLFARYYTQAKLQGWKPVFSGKVATIYIREKHVPSP